MRFQKLDRASLEALFAAPRDNQPFREAENLIRANSADPL